MLRAPALLSHPDVIILGAGVIGLSLALELHRRGAHVSIYEPRAAAAQATWAAAGMLAARDPFNPPTLAPLAHLSAQLYPAFLQELGELSGQDVPFQTERTLQTMPDGQVESLPEHSVDPRQLALSLIGAVQHRGIPIHGSSLYNAPPGSRRRSDAQVVVHTTGAWAAVPAIFPRKGQMLRVQIPPEAAFSEVYRAEHIYVVPRTAGPQAGTALIGATVEDAGYNTETVPEDLTSLRAQGAAFVPALADPQRAPLVEAWAGLRPGTPDELPLLGPLPGADGTGPRHLIAAGHFRNGILLAPATAVLMADLVEHRTPSADLRPFSPARFAGSGGLIP
jgi:glycine oxidase